MQVKSDRRRLFYFCFQLKLELHGITHSRTTLNSTLYTTQLYSANPPLSYVMLPHTTLRESAKHSDDVQHCFSHKSRHT